MPGQKLLNMLLFVLGSCFVLLSHAQSKYTITPFTSREGMVSSEIITLFQDARNFLWIGHAAGASRYDGYRFEDFLFTTTHQLGKTYSIAEDKHHNLWIGTENGLFLYTGREMEHISSGKTERPVYALHFDETGSLWIGTSDGAFYISKELLQQTILKHRLPLQQYLLTAWKKRFPVGNNVVSISLGADNSVYFGDGYAVYKYWERQIIDVWRSKGHEDQLKGIVAVNKDTVYICSGSRGIQAVENDRYRQSHSKIGLSNALIKKDGSLFCYAAEEIYTINRFTLVAEPLFGLPDYLQEWGSCFLRDNENNFWLGTHENLSYARPDIFTVLHQSLPAGFDELYCVDTLQDGSLICGGNLGTIFRADKNKKDFKVWKKIFPRAQVTAVFHEQPDATWFSSW